MIFHLKLFRWDLCYVDPIRIPQTKAKLPTSRGNILLVLTVFIVVFFGLEPHSSTKSDMTRYNRHRLRRLFHILIKYFMRHFILHVMRKRLNIRFISLVILLASESGEIDGMKYSSVRPAATAQFVSSKHNIFPIQKGFTKRTLVTSVCRPYSHTLLKP